jgi:hypothetical protein
MGAASIAPIQRDAVGMLIVLYFVAMVPSVRYFSETGRSVGPETARIK